MDEGGEVTAIVEDHVEGLAVGEGSQSLLDAPVVLVLSLALPRVNGDTRSGDTNNTVSVGGYG